MDHTQKREQISRRKLSSLILTILIVLISTDFSYAYFQEDPRIPASDHPLSDSLAPAMARLNTSCTAWITKGGMLITAGHCYPESNDIVEFNVPLSEPDGEINYSSSEDIYTVSEVINSDDNTPDRDWAIFRVNDNPVTGLQPIEAQLVYIELVQDLTGDIYRSMGYGDDLAGVPPGPLRKTLRTDSGENLTQNTTGDLVEFKSQLIGGDSGSPIVDESTGKSVGVATNFRTSDDVAEGTSAYRSSFWNTFQAELNDFTLSVTQKDEAGQTIIGSSIGRWNETIFNDYVLSGSEVQLNVVEGGIEILRADQGVYNNPNEKYNEWIGFNDVRNHRVFQMDAGASQLISQFQKTHSGISVTNAFPEAPSLSGSGQIQFKDPWLIDYNDPDFDNSPRNRGMDAVFYSHSAPFNPGFNTINGKLYNGLFLNESGPTENWQPPYYSVRNEPQSINFGGSLGSRQVAPIGWEGDDVGFEDPNSKETAVVFTDAGAEARAKLKISRISNDATAYANNSQRKVVRTSDGWLHMVYESLGRVWVEHSDDDGATWTLGNYGNPLDTGAGKNPSIDWLYAGSTYGNYVVVVYQQKNGSYYKIMGKIFKRGSSGYHHHTDFNMGTVGSTESYSVDANPNITLGGDPNNNGVGDFTLTVEKKNGTAGIYYLYGELSGNGDIMSSSQVTYLSGTNANSTNTSVHINKMYNNLDVFHIVYQQGSGSVKHKFIECSPSGSSWYCTNTYTSNLSSSTGQQNYKPSMVQMPNGGIRVSWIRALYGQSSPYWMNTVYWSTSSPSQYTIRGYFVRSVSLNISDDNSKYLYAWSEQVDSWYANYLSNGSSNTKLSTSGEEVQLSNGTGSGANMLVSSFDRTSTPYTFKYGKYRQQSFQSIFRYTH